MLNIFIKRRLIDYMLEQLLQYQGVGWELDERGRYKILMYNNDDHIIIFPEHLSLEQFKGYKRMSHLHNLNPSVLYLSEPQQDHETFKEAMKCHAPMSIGPIYNLFEGSVLYTVAPQLGKTKIVLGLETLFDRERHNKLIRGMYENATEK